MPKNIYTLVPCNDETGDWFAKITATARSGKFFKIEAHRKIEPEHGLRAFKTRSNSPFDRVTIPCFLKLAFKGTLDRVSVLEQSIGATGPAVVFETQKVLAEAQYILFGEGYDFDFLPTYSSVTFRPSGLAQWVSDGLGRPSADHFKSTDTRLETFAVDSLGRFGIFLSHEGAIGIGKDSRKFTPYLSIEFSHPRSFVQIAGICAQLDSMFSFLTMTAVKPSKLILKPADADDPAQRHTLLRSGQLWNYPSRDRTHTRFLSRKDVPSLAMVIDGAMKSWGESTLLLEAINQSLHFSESCDDCFRKVFPRLERFLDAWFSGKDDADFRQHKDKFFHYIASSDDSSIKEFSRKHISVKDKKSRSLLQKLEKAIMTLNEAIGSKIDFGNAREICDFRTTQFHGTNFVEVAQATANCEKVAGLCNFMLVVFILETMKIERIIYAPKLKLLFPDIFDPS